MAISPIVAVRSRPISANEAQYELQNPNQRRSRSSSTMNGATGAVRSTDDSTVTISNTAKAGGNTTSTETYSMTCDHVLVPHRNSHAGLYNASQEAVFDAVSPQIISASLEGRSSTIMAYGASGSGKTYTMVGTPAAPGLIPRIITALISAPTQAGGRNSGGLRRDVEISVFELYNESVRDLMNPSTLDKAFKVKQHPWRGVYIDGITTVKVDSAQDLRQWLKDSLMLRTVGTTNSNAHSSRGHCIVSAEIRCYPAGTSSSDTTTSAVLYSKVLFLDLAGSERLSQGGVGASGSRIVVESNSAINKSLSGLTTILRTLAQASERVLQASGGTSAASDSIFINPQTLQPPLPIRDAQLSLLLRETIVGKHRLTFLATISPASISYADSLHTLQVAKDVRSIRMPMALLAPCSRDPAIQLVELLRDEITGIRGKLRELQESSVNGVVSLSSGPSKPELLQSLVEATEMLQEAAETRDEKAIKQKMFLSSRSKNLAKLRSNRRIPVNTGLPRLHVLNEDLASISAAKGGIDGVGVLPVYYLEDGENSIGRATNACVSIPASAETNLQLFHCSIRVNSLQRKVTLLMPKEDDDDGLSELADVFINGVKVPPGSPPLLLRHLDRLIFGSIAFRHAQPASWTAEEDSGKNASGVSCPFSKEPSTPEHAILLEEHGRLQTHVDAFDALTSMLDGDVDSAIDASPGIMETKAELAALVARLTLEYPVSEKSVAAASGGQSVHDALSFDFKFAMAELARGKAVVPDNSTTNTASTQQSAFRLPPGPSMPVASPPAAASGSSTAPAGGDDDLDDFFDQLIKKDVASPPVEQPDGRPTRGAAPGHHVDPSGAGASDDLDGFIDPSLLKNKGRRRGQSTVKFADDGEDATKATRKVVEGPESANGNQDDQDQSGKARADSVVVELPPQRQLQVQATEELEIDDDDWDDDDEVPDENLAQQQQGSEQEKQQREGKQGHGEYEDDDDDDDENEAAGESVFGNRSPNTLSTDDLPTASDFPHLVSEGDASAGATALRLMVMEDASRYHSEVARSRAWRSGNILSQQAAASGGGGGALAEASRQDQAQHPKMLLPKSAAVATAPPSKKDLASLIADVGLMYDAYCGSDGSNSTGRPTLEELAALTLDPSSPNFAHHQAALIPNSLITKLRVRKSFFHRGGFFPVRAIVVMRFLFYADRVEDRNPPVRGSCYLYGASLKRIAVGEKAFCIQIDPVAKRKPTKPGKETTDDNSIVLGFETSEEREDWYRRLSFSVLPAVSSSLSKYFGVSVEGIDLGYSLLNGVTASAAKEQQQQQAAGSTSSVINNSSSSSSFTSAGHQVEKLSCIPGEIESFALSSKEANVLRSAEETSRASELTMRRSALKSLLQLPPPSPSSDLARSASSVLVSSLVDEAAACRSQCDADAAALEDEVNKDPRKRLPLRLIVNKELFKRYFLAKEVVVVVTKTTKDEDRSSPSPSQSPKSGGGSADVVDSSNGAKLHVERHDVTWLINLFASTLESVDVARGKAYVFRSNELVSFAEIIVDAPSSCSSSSDARNGIALEFLLHNKRYTYVLELPSRAERDAFIEAVMLCRKHPRVYAPGLLATSDLLKLLSASSASSSQGSKQSAGRRGEELLLPSLLIASDGGGGTAKLLLPRLPEGDYDTWVDGEDREACVVARNGRGGGGVEKESTTSAATMKLEGSCTLRVSTRLRQAATVWVGTMNMSGFPLTNPDVIRYWLARSDHREQQQGDLSSAKKRRKSQQQRSASPSADSVSPTTSLFESSKYDVISLCFQDVAKGPHRLRSLVSEVLRETHQCVSFVAHGRLVLALFLRLPLVCSHRTRTWTIPLLPTSSAAAIAQERGAVVTALTFYNSSTLMFVGVHLPYDQTKDPSGKHMLLHDLMQRLSVTMLLSSSQESQGDDITSFGMFHHCPFVQSDHVFLQGDFGHVSRLNPCTSRGGSGGEAQPSSSDKTFTIQKLNTAVLALRGGGTSSPSSSLLMEELVRDHDELVHMRRVGKLLVGFTEGPSSSTIPSYAPTSKVEVGTCKYNLFKDPIPSLSARVMSLSNNSWALCRRCALQQDGGRAGGQLLEMLQSDVAEELQAGADCCVAQTSVSPDVAGDASLMLSESLPVRSVYVLSILRRPARSVSSCDYEAWVDDMKRRSSSTTSKAPASAVGDRSIGLCYFTLVRIAFHHSTLHPDSKWPLKVRYSVFPQPVSSSSTSALAAEQELVVEKSIQGALRAFHQEDGSIVYQRKRAAAAGKDSSTSASSAIGLECAVHHPAALYDRQIAVASRIVVSVLSSDDSIGHHVVGSASFPLMLCVCKRQGYGGGAGGGGVITMPLVFGTRLVGELSIDGN